jgi:hypothetical protein
LYFKQQSIYFGGTMEHQESSANISSIICNTDPVDLNKIDPGIRETVALLRNNNFNTISSCEGGEAHQSFLPMVRVTPNEDESLMELRDRLVKCLINNGYSGFNVNLSFAYQSQEAHKEEMSYAELVIWRVKVATK